MATVSPRTAAQRLTAVGGDRSRLVVLHTNDVHSHIEPMPANDVKYPGQGGYARRTTYIAQTRAEGVETLVMEAGDMFQGTPYFNFYNGALEISLMNRMGVDVVTIGNHEFDLGMVNLCDRMVQANFPFVCANYTFADPRAASLVSPYKVFERCGRRIGVVGLGVELEGLVTEKNHGGTIYEDPIVCGNRMAKLLKEQERCDMVIALTHIGFAGEANHVDDCTLAAHSEDIDMILGGHSHTFLEAPVWVDNASGRRVLVNQAGYGGVIEGRIVVDFDGDGIAHIGGSAIAMV